MVPKMFEPLKFDCIENIVEKEKLLLTKEQYLLFSTIFRHLLDFHVKTGTRFSLHDKRLFEISKVKITRVYCISFETADICSIFKNQNSAKECFGTGHEHCEKTFCYTGLSDPTQHIAKLVTTYCDWLVL